MVTTPITTPPSTPHVLHNKPVVAMCISPWPCTIRVYVCIHAFDAPGRVASGRVGRKGWRWPLAWPVIYNRSLFPGGKIVCAGLRGHLSSSNFLTACFQHPGNWKARFRFRFEHSTGCFQLIRVNFSEKHGRIWQGKGSCESMGLYLQKHAASSAFWYTFVSQSHSLCFIIVSFMKLLFCVHFLVFKLSKLSRFSEVFTFHKIQPFHTIPKLLPFAFYEFCHLWMWCADMKFISNSNTMHLSMFALRSRNTQSQTRDPSSIYA